MADHGGLVLLIKMQLKITAKVSVYRTIFRHKPASLVARKVATNRFFTHAKSKKGVSEKGVEREAGVTHDRLEIRNCVISLPERNF